MARIILSIFGLGQMAVYFITSRIPSTSRRIYEKFARPLHDLFAGLCDLTPVCVFEILVVCLVLAVFLYVIFSVIFFIRDLKDKERSALKRVFSFLLTFFMLFCLIYGGFCMLWGPYYSAPDVSEVCGIEANPEGVLHSDLIAVDEGFVNLANEYSTKVSRDADGYFTNTGDPFEHASVLYRNISVKYPGLKSVTHRPKKFFFSRILSYMDFTGFFSPFTGEACINTDSPSSMTPVTIAHELAHQRGIAAEDEANFIAVITCLEDGDADYVYSASLFALSHLQNALYKSGDVEEWERIRSSYSEGVQADLAKNREYWNSFRDSAVHQAVSDTYDAFLKSYDQELGRETYGACVDLLVEYYRQIW